MTAAPQNNTHLTRPRKPDPNPHSLWMGIGKQLERVEVFYCAGRTPRYEVHVDRMAIHTIPATRKWATEQRIAIQFAQRLCGALPATGKPTQTAPGISVQAISKLGYLMAENAHADDPARDLAQLTEWYMELAWSLAEHDLEFFNECMAGALCTFNERCENDEYHAKDRVTYY